MKKLFSVLKYCKHYKSATTLSVLFNIFFAIFSAASIAFVIPFLDLLFKTDTSDIHKIVLTGPPEFSATASYLQKLSNYYLSYLIDQRGKADTLFMICVAVFIVTFFKNICRYFAMFFLAIIRNGVIRDLRNKIYNKSLQLPLSYYSEE